MAAYGCLPELEAHDPTDAKLAVVGVLKRFLRNNPRHRVSSLDDIADHGEIFQWCIRDLRELEYQKKFKEDYFRPLVAADTNRDGNSDLVAVLVNDGKFNVAIFQGVGKGRFSKPYWLIRDDPEIILGVSVLEDGLIIPHYCIACDSNPRFRWVGSGYEVNGHLPGEQVCVEDEAVARLTPDPSSRTTWYVDKNQLARIVRVGPRTKGTSTETPGFRWYQVKSSDSPTSIGYVPSNKLLEGPGECD